MGFIVSYATVYFLTNRSKWYLLALTLHTSFAPNMKSFAVDDNGDETEVRGDVRAEREDLIIVVFDIIFDARGLTTLTLLAKAL